MKTISKQHFDITVKTDSLKQWTDGKITGVIYWEVNCQIFPDCEWNDFIIIVLQWWIHASIRLLRHTSDNETMMFMDGPYDVICTQKKGVVTVQFADRYDNSKITTSFEVTMLDLCKTILHATNDTLQACYIKKYTGPEIKYLEKKSSNLRQLIRENLADD